MTHQGQSHYVPAKSFIPIAWLDTISGFRFLELAQYQHRQHKILCAQQADTVLALSSTQPHLFGRSHERPGLLQQLHTCAAQHGVLPAHDGVHLTQPLGPLGCCVPNQGQSQLPQGCLRPQLLHN